MTAAAPPSDAMVCLLALRRRSELDRIAGELAADLGAAHGLPWRMAVADGEAARTGIQFGYPAFDIVVEVGIPTGQEYAAESAVASAVAAVRGTLTADRSEVLVGSEYVLRSGRGRFVLYWCMKRRPDVEAGLYRSHMLTSHAEFGLTIPGEPGYAQVHVHPVAPDRLRALGLRHGLADSVSRVEFSDEGAVEIARPSDDRLQTAAADGQLVGDTSLSLVAFMADVAGSNRDGR